MTGPATIVITGARRKTAASASSRVAAASSRAGTMSAGSSGLPRPMNALHMSIAAMPFLASLASRSVKAIVPCLIASGLTGLLADVPQRAVVAWCVGILIAAVAVRERLHTG